MNIFRPDNGIYHCINDPNNTSKYVLVEDKDSLPRLVLLCDENGDPATKEMKCPVCGSVYR